MDNEEKNEPLKPTNDYVFRKIFGEVGNEEITADFIEKVLDKKYDSIDLSKNPILLPEAIDGKTTILDVTVKANGTENINIEMQVAPYKYMTERILEYWAKKYDEGIKRGDKYDIAQRTVCILLTCFDIKELKEIDEFHTKWNIREEKHSDIILTSKLEFHIINLNNLDKVITVNEKEKALLNWCRFITSPESLEESIMKENDKILKAKEVLDRLNDNEEERKIAYQRQRAIRYQNALRESGYDEGFEVGKEKGLEDGIKQGVEQGKKDIVRKMLDNNINIDMIIKITGLTKEQIENIK